MEATEAVEPSVAGGKVGDAQTAGDGTGLALQHGTGDTEAAVLLLLVPVPDHPVGFFVAGSSGATFAGADVRIGRPFLLLPFAQVTLPLAQNVEDLRLAASELQGKLAHGFAALPGQNHLNPLGETQLLALTARRYVGGGGRRRRRRNGDGEVAVVVCRRGRRAR